MAGRERAEVDRVRDGDVEAGAPQALGQDPVGGRGA
jgi:hypothetical protein